ncbi:MAG: hypothetical protein RRA35_05855, partial [Desulfomonilia bacterium]|nr:hypothetical protein [Desulfomonilia bacterium]
MITDILYRCPVCGDFDWLDNTRCSSCQARIDILSRSRISVNGHTDSLAAWYAKIRSFELPQRESGIILHSGTVRLSTESVKGPYRGFAGVTATLYGRRELETGSLVLKHDELFFSAASGDRHIPLTTITSVTIESNTIIIIARKHGVLFFDFLQDSGKKWEDCIQKALAHTYGSEQIIEYYPRILLKKYL